jgi:TetR/AcrR family transcriptional regulator, cholesterol catabolism regulator
MTKNGNLSPKERILAAGTELFIRNGYHGTGVQELSDAVGMGRGALYYHIGNKEQLLFEISMLLLQRATDAAAPAATSTESPDVKLGELARALLVHHSTYGEAWSVVLSEARFLSDEHRLEVITARDSYEAIWTQVLKDGAVAGLWREVDGVDIRGILGMLNSSARWMQPGGVLTPEEIADRYVDLIVQGLGK